MEELVLRAQQGDRQLREQLLQEYQPFIVKIASQTVGRFLNWGVDEELNIALTAFDEAILRFQQKKGTPFLPFAALVIRSRLLDWLRAEQRHQHLSLDIENEQEENFSPAELQLSLAQYQARSLAEERGLELALLEEKLRPFAISFNDLVDSAPRHRDTKQALVKAARYLAQNQSLFQQLLEKKTVPAKQLAEVSGVSLKTLEKGRKYLIAVALILHDATEFVHLIYYLKPLLQLEEREQE